jgi:hypothetical protein
LEHKTAYNLDFFRLYIQARLPPEWSIQIVDTKDPASKKWPAPEYKQIVKEWLEDSECPNIVQIMERLGTVMLPYCSDVAFAMIGDGNHASITTYLHSECLARLNMMSGIKQAEVVFEYLKEADWYFLKGPFLGTEKADRWIQKAIDGMRCCEIIEIPAYRFADSELTEAELFDTLSADYRLVPVVIMVEPDLHSIWILDSAAVQPNFTMEFIIMPLQKRGVPTTTITQFDIEVHTPVNSELTSVLQQIFFPVFFC